VRLAITPATGVGRTISSLLHDVGITVGAHGLESACGLIAFALTAGLGAVLLWRVRLENMVLSLGVLLLAAAAGGPAAWPWYFTWGLVLLAACPGPQRSRAFAFAIAVSVFLVKPSGSLAVPIQASPVVVTVYALLAGAAWYTWRRGHDDHGTAGRAPSVSGGAPPVLARS
jgi:predicted Na+-dependent transporter